MGSISKYIARKLFLKNRVKPVKGVLPMVMTNDLIGQSIILNGFYEKDLVTTIFNAFDFDPSNCNCLDVGCNIGNHAVQFKDHFKKVSGFEPQKRTFKILTLNTEHYDNVHVHNFGLSSSPGEFTLNIPYANSGGGSHVALPSEKHYYVESIELKVYDDEFDEEIAFVKIDVEGNEVDVIEGMKKTIEKYKPVISFEYNRDQKNEIINLLNTFGYRDFFKPKSHFMNKIIGSDNLYPPKKLEKVIMPYKKDCSLLTTFHPNSKFKLKL